MGEQSPHALEGLLGVQGGLIAVGCHQLDGGPAPVPPDLQLLQQLRQGDAAVAWDQMAVAVPIAVHQMEVGHPPAQLIQIVRDGLPDDPGGHHIAHTHKSGRIHLLQRLGQLPGSGADIGLIGGEGLQQNGVADGLGVIRQFPEAADETAAELPAGGGVAAVSGGDEGMVRAQRFAHVEAELQIVQGVCALELTPQHVVVRIGIVLGGVDPHGHLMALDEGQNSGKLSRARSGAKAWGRPPQSSI